MLDPVKGVQTFHNVSNPKIDSSKGNQPISGRKQRRKLLDPMELTHDTLNLSAIAESPTLAQEKLRSSYNDSINEEKVETV